MSAASAGTGSTTGAMPSTTTRNCASGVADAPAVTVAATVIVSPAVPPMMFSILRIVSSATPPMVTVVSAAPASVMTTAAALSA